MATYQPRVNPPGAPTAGEQSPSTSVNPSGPLTPEGVTSDAHSNLVSMALFAILLINISALVMC